MALIKMKAVLLLLCTFIVSGIVATTLPIGYSISNTITWSGIVDDDGTNMTVTGTSLEDIEVQVQQIHPSFLLSRNDTVAVTGLNSTSKYDVTGMDCNAGGDNWARKFVLDQGVDYLRGVTGDCYAGPGPAACGRISCSWGAGIWWCNDNPYSFVIPCRDLAQYAADLTDKCKTWCNGCSRVGEYMARGQEFDAQGFNVLVGHAPNGC